METGREVAISYTISKDVANDHRYHIDRDCRVLGLAALIALVFWAAKQKPT